MPVWLSRYDERRHTSNDPGFLASCGYAGADRYIDEPAVIDGDLVTATGVAPVHFARAVFERLDAHDPKLIDSWFKLYANRDPAGFYRWQVLGAVLFTRSPRP